jgi:hypothetical protein
MLDVNEVPSAWQLFRVKSVGRDITRRHLMAHSSSLVYVLTLSYSLIMRLISWRLSGSIDIIVQPSNDITSLVEKGVSTYSIGSALEI